MSEEVKKNEEDLNKDAQKAEFAYGATLDEENRFEKTVEDAKESVGKFAKGVSDKFEEVKNDPELKAKIDNAKEKTAKAFNDGKEKVTEFYQSEKVQNTLKGVGEKAGQAKKFASDKFNEIKNNPDVEEGFSKAKSAVNDATVKVGSKLKELFKKEK